MRFLVRKLEGQRAGFYDPTRNSAMGIQWLFGTNHDQPMQCAILGIILVMNPKKTSRFTSYLLDLSGSVSLGVSSQWHTHTEHKFQAKYLQIFCLPVFPVVP